MSKHLCIVHGTMGDGLCPACKPQQSQAEQIYAEYPRKVGRPVALKAIQKALKNHSFDFLLERTKAFAAVRNGDVSFVPNPSTWFNQERFNDDPSTWKPAGKTPLPVRRENINPPITRR